MEDWVKNLKEGDKVIVCCGQNEDIKTVERVTPHFFSTEQYRFNKQTLTTPGRQYKWGSKICCEPATLENISRINNKKTKSNLISKIKKDNLLKLSIPELKEILSILQTD